MSPLSLAQTEQLLQPVHPDRVLFKRGLAYLEAYEVKAHLNRVFGFAGWSEEVLRTTSQERASKGTIHVLCEAHVRLTIHAGPAAYSDVGVAGEHGPSEDWAGIHHRAVTAAAASAFKRAASNLGDQFGLSLYGDGSLDPIVRHTLETAGGGDVQDGSRPVAEGMAHLRQTAANELRDLSRQTGIDPAKIAQRFHAVNDVAIDAAHPSQILAFTTRVRDATRPS